MILSVFELGFVVIIQVLFSLLSGKNPYYQCGLEDMSYADVPIEDTLW